MTRKILVICWQLLKSKNRFLIIFFYLFTREIYLPRTILVLKDDFFTRSSKRTRRLRFCEKQQPFSDSAVDLQSTQTFRIFFHIEMSISQTKNRFLTFLQKNLPKA